MGNSMTTLNTTTPTATLNRNATKNHNNHSHHHPNCAQQQQQQQQHSQSTLGGRSQKSRKTNASNSNPEGSRVLFLLYLIHRTWNVVVDTVDPKARRSRSSRASISEDSGAPRSYFDGEDFETDSVNDDEDVSRNNCSSRHRGGGGDDDDGRRGTNGGRRIHDTNNNGHNNNRCGEKKRDDQNDDQSLYGGSQYSFCSCGHCNNEPKRNPLYGRTELRLSFCESELSYCIGYQMAPSAGKSPPGGAPPQTMIANTGGGGGGGVGGSVGVSGGSIVGSIGQIRKLSTEISIGPNSQPKENQRPPVYNAEDYILSLKKYNKRTQGSTNRSIYDTTDSSGNNNADNSLNLHTNSSTLSLSSNTALEHHRTSTLPTIKQSEYKSPIPTPPETDCEMSLRQFGSITDLLTKLRADLRASFPSFVQELVASPMDGVSLLLEVLRAIQLSQTANYSANGSTTMQRNNNQSYQRRALLDELACLQCLNLCTSRSPEAGARLGTSPVGLLPLAASATGQGIRSRILALQLLTTACDKLALGHGSQKSVQCGHTSVSEALSTLRLRCGEPVRFRLLVGMLNSGGGSGELQTYGLKFINTFLGSAENAQTRLYLQAELYQAGFDHLNMTKTISTSSAWLEKLKFEVKHFEETKIDVEKLIVQARDADRVRSQMVILERRVQILQEEKTVLTSMERRLQERCADLQRDIFRLQGAHHPDGYKSLEKRPIALPRHVPPHSTAASTNHQSNPTTNNNSNNTRASSEQDDEGISSSETGQSLSPEPPTILILPQQKMQQQKYRLNVLGGGSNSSTANPAAGGATIGGADVLGSKGKDDDATIDDVIEELANIVSDAEREIISINNDLTVTMRSSASSLPDDIRSAYNQRKIEKEIVPVNLLPQPPKKSRSFSHLLSNGGSEYDDSDYGMIMMPTGGNSGDVGLHQNGSRVVDSYFDDLEFDRENHRFGRRLDQDDIDDDDDHHHHRHHGVGNIGNGGGSGNVGGIINPDVVNPNSTNREILNVIMDAREKDEGLSGFMLSVAQQQTQSHPMDMDISSKTITNSTPVAVPGIGGAGGGSGVVGINGLPVVTPHKFSGVFFMAEMSSAQKYPKPDITAALEARRVTKNLDRMESYGSGIDSMIDIVMTETANKQKIQSNQILLTGSKTQRFQFNAGGGGGSGIGHGGIGGGIIGLKNSTAALGGSNYLRTNNNNTHHSSSNTGSKLTDLPSGLY